MRARIAQDLTRVFFISILGEVPIVVIVLSRDDCIQCPDGAALVPSYTAENELLFSVRRIEIPTAGILIERNWRRPVLCTYNQEKSAIGSIAEAMHLIVGLEESLD